MSLVFMEGFETYRDADGDSVSLDDLNKFWDEVVGGFPAIKTGRDGGFSLRIGSSGNPAALKTKFIADDSKISIGFGYYIGNVISTNILTIRDASGNDKFTLKLQSDGDLEVDAAGAGHDIAESTSDQPISAATWYFIELEVVFNGTTGSWLLKVDGTEKLNSTSKDTIPTGVSTNWRYVEFRSAGQVTLSDNARFDDIYICDSTGSINNQLLGEAKITISQPNGDTATEDFTPSTGSDSYALIDEQEPNDADYVESGTNGHKNLHDYSNVSVAGTIHGINVRTRAQKTGAQDVRLISKAKSGATNSDGSEEPASPDLVEHSRILETDPNTSSKWIESNLNSAQFGFEVSKP